MTAQDGGGAAITAADLDAAKVEILQKLDDARSRSRRSEIGMYVFQGFLGAVIGLLVWWLQMGVNHQIEDAKAVLSARLALSQEYFKQRLTIYTQLHGFALGLRDAAIQETPASSLRHTLLATNSKKLYECYTANSLYVSPALLELVGQVWREALDADRAAAGGASESQLPGLTDKMEDLMRQDLHVEELADLFAYERK
jgi:hypothetical protein